MAYCINCGVEIVDGAKYCQKCGSPVLDAVGNQSRREQVFEGKIYKCPNCGEVLKSFTRNCPSCGMELRGTKATSSVREFALKLEAIESKREYEKPGLFAMLNNRDRISKTDEQKISLIQSFSVPNTKEDMLEFMILASSNINVRSYDSTSNSVTKSEKALNDAWVAKVKQVFDKARRSYGDESDFNQIEELYNECNRNIKKAKKKNIIKWVLLLWFIPVGIIATIVACVSAPGINASEEERLEAIVNDVEIALQQEDFRLALRTAESIEYEGVDEERDRWWNVKKESLIDEVIAQAAENGIILERSQTVNDESKEDGGGGFLEGFQKGYNEALESE